VKHEYWKVHAAKHVMGEPAEYRFPDTAMAIGAHDEEISLHIRRCREKRLRRWPAARRYHPALHRQAMPSELLNKRVQRSLTIQLLFNRKYGNLLRLREQRHCRSNRASSFRYALPGYSNPTTDAFVHLGSCEEQRSSDAEQLSQFSGKEAICAGRIRNHYDIAKTAQLHNLNRAGIGGGSYS
jgi:hypothetical protein